MGRDEQLDFLRRRAEKGKPTPTIDNWPVLHEHLAFYYEEFARLSSRRGTGMSGPAPLSGDEIDRRARQLGLTESEARRFAELIEHMDRVLLNFRKEDKDGNA